MGLWILETASVSVFKLKNVPKHLSLSQKDTICQQSHSVYVSVVLHFLYSNNVTWMTNEVNFCLFEEPVMYLKCETSTHLMWKYGKNSGQLLSYNWQNLKYLWVVSYWAAHRLGKEALSDSPLSFSLLFFWHSQREIPLLCSSAVLSHSKQKKKKILNRKTIVAPEKAASQSVTCAFM